MPGLHLHRSNRLEALAGVLVEVLRSPAADVFAPEVVVVQSLGMRRWIQLQLAARTGVAMNIEFPFPAEFATRVLHAAVPEVRETSAFSREVLPWRVLELFPRLLDEEAFAPLRQYVGGELRALKEFQLAQKVAGLFDRYLAYRPELLLEWSSNRDPQWQARLWRELARPHRESHPPRLVQRGIAALREGRVDPARLPRRLGIFGISSLPPVYLDLIDALGSGVEVHLFLLEPTADYWADVSTPKEEARRARRPQVPQLSPEEEPGTRNSLLAALGKTGRDFSWLLLDRIEAAGEDDHFVPPEPATLLGALQADIFTQSEDGPRPDVSPDDRSLQIHCCHGPMRELEVLHDQLLALFEQQPELTPRDVLVTMPDVEAYAPLIDAVFGAPESEALRIPYTIADRAAHAENSIAAALLQVLDLVGSRFTASAVLGLLDTPAVRARFELTEADLPSVRHWVERSGIRWGIDAAHRGRLDMDFAQNTWRSGLDRLLLGYALPGDGTQLFAGLLPEPAAEGQAARKLGQFVEFAERVFEHCAALEKPHPPGGWEKALRRVLDGLFADTDEFADERRRVARALEGFRAATAEAGFEAPLEFAVMRAHLAGLLADDGTSGGFLAGRVTFCALKPMRSIPFRVICLLGLDDTAFPRRDHPLSFDLMAQRPQRGDRTTRDDDRYLFLEAILSARETLYLSYSGLSIRDNSEAPPSVVVAELLDYLARRFAVPRDFVLKHPLQPFSAAYFSGEVPRLFSYSRDQAAAAGQGAGARSAPAPFIRTPLPPADAEWQEVSLGQLTEFLGNPARYFLEERLRLALPGVEAPTADGEPTALDGLTSYGLRDELTERSLEARTLAASLETVRARGVLPLGYAGTSAYGELAHDVAQLLARLGDSLDAPPLDPLPVSLEAGGWRLVGQLTGVRPQGLVRYRAARSKPKDLLAGWVAHLALQLTSAPVRVTTVHALDGTVRLRPLEDAAGLLAMLLQLYARGLTAPVAHFPRASRKFVEASAGSGDALAAARQEFAQESAHCPWVRLATRGIEDPLAGDFAEIARAVWVPLLAAMEEAS